MRGRSKIKGVYWLGDRGKWQVVVYDRGKRKSLGTFNNMVDAEEVREEHDFKKKQEGAEDRIFELEEIVRNAQDEIDHLRSVYLKHYPTSPAPPGFEHLEHPPTSPAPPGFEHLEEGFL